MYLCIVQHGELVLIKYLTPYTKPETAVVTEDGQVYTRWVHYLDRQRHFNIMRMKVPPDLTAEDLVDYFNETVERAVLGKLCIFFYILVTRLTVDTYLILFRRKIYKTDAFNYNSKLLLLYPLLSNKSY
jgi:hypothetical protein